MADTSGMADLRGIDIDKLAKGFAEEKLILKSLVNVSATKAREVRWYQKTSGFLDTTDTTAMTASRIKTVPKAKPEIIEQSWTRTTSYVKAYKAETPWIAIEDINDCDVDMLATHVRDIVRAVQYQEEIAIYDAVTDDAARLTGAATADGWDDTATGNPILDILTAKQAIRSYGYDPDEGGVLLINSIEEKNLINFLINVKGSSIPQYASELTKGALSLTGLLKLRVVVSELATTDEAVVFIPKKACTWKEFIGIQSAVLDDPGVAKKIRVWGEGVPLVTDPKAIYLITDTVV